jgi:pyruvate,water dikinase
LDPANVSVSDCQPKWKFAPEESNPAFNPSKEVKDMQSEKWLFWFDELGKEHNDLVGKKCANLGEMTKMGVRVPTGFAISVDAWARFMEMSGVGVRIKRFFEQHKDEFSAPTKGREASSKIRELIETQEMPDEMVHQIARNYELLCEMTGVCDVPVAVRSSGAVSMPGAMETYLNIKGEEDVVKKVLKVWGSAYTHRATVYRFQEGLPIDYAPIGVAVMRLVDAKAAGVMMTANPTTGNTSEFVIESNWGLGESVVSGITNSDRYIVEREGMKITDRAINKKLKRVVMGGNKTEVADMPVELQEVSSLTDEEIIELAKVGLKIEEHFQVPTDIEWAYDANCPFPENLFLVQARPMKAMPKYRDAVDKILDMLLKKGL